MQPIDAQYLTLLKSSVRAPRVYVQAQLPLITNALLNTIDPSKLGSMLVIQNVTAFRSSSILESGADSTDFVLDNTAQKYSPLTNSSSLGRYFTPGAIDIKYQIFLGLNLNGAETVLPKGVFVSESVAQGSTHDAHTLTVNCLDQFSTFRGDAYTSFPPRLYGVQNNPYYNPNYALTNPSGDNKTFIGETGNWMQTQGQSPLWASDYVPVAVYMSNSQSGAIAINNSGTTTYTVDFANGKVTFTSAQAAGVIVSVDARPLSMAPELALKHLFVDFGSWDPNFLKFDDTGIQIPLVELSRDRPIMDIARDIVSMTAPRGIIWQLYMDANGFIRFTEGSPDAGPVRTLVDTKDIISFTPEYTVRDMHNVVRANATAFNNQPLTSIAYDVGSISTYGLKPVYDVPQQFLNTTKGSDSGAAMAYLNGLTSSQLFLYSTPTIMVDIEILPDYALEVGDLIGVVEDHTGLTDAEFPTAFIINQIDNDIQGADGTMKLRLQQYKMSQDYMFGMSANIGAPQPINPNQIQAQAGFISDVSIAGTAVVTNGQPSTGNAMQPEVAVWNASGALPISISVVPPAGGALYIWRWMYIAEDAYAPSGIVTGNGSSVGMTSYPSNPGAAWGADLVAALSGLFNTSTLPYDVRTNADTTISRRYWWPLLRCADWRANDGVTTYTTNTTLTSTWSGFGYTNATVTPFGSLRIGINDYFTNTSGGFVGVQLYNNTPAAVQLGQSSTMKYGVDFGQSYSNKTIYAGIKRKHTPMYLGILVATTTGGMQLKRIPFILQN
jgi:hypothetical protein